MCVEVIVCYIIVVFLRHGVDPKPSPLAAADDFFDQLVAAAEKIIG